MITCTTHRLDGLEPDNLLAFLALLGLLRILEESRSAWRPRVFWAVDTLPIRPSLITRESITKEAILSAVSEGFDLQEKMIDPDWFYRLEELKKLKNKSGFSRENNTELDELNKYSDLKLSPEKTSKYLKIAACSDRYRADLWASLTVDKVIRKDGFSERTPLCLMTGQGHQHFLSRLVSVPQDKVPLSRIKDHKKIKISELDCLNEALFAPWMRSDETFSFRWDPHEDVRYELRATDPSKSKPKTQHGANRLAVMGLSALTMVPQRRTGKIGSNIIGGNRNSGGGFIFTWPIWTDPISLTTIRALLSHPKLNDPMTRSMFRIVECRRTRRILSGKFMNFTKAESI